MMAEIEFEQETCRCGLTFMLPSEFVRHRRKDHEWFYCPSCNRAWRYGRDNEEEKLKKEVLRLKGSRDFYKGARERESKRLEHEIRVRTGHQGHAAKLKKQLDIQPEEIK